MRLSDVLSKSPNEQFHQVEGFLDEKKLNAGKQKQITIGNIGLSFFCKTCEDTHTFCSKNDIYCIGVDDNSVSIDCVLACSRCNSSTVSAWFVLKSDNQISSRDPKVKIFKRSFKLSDDVLLSANLHSGFEEMLQKAGHAYSEGLGAGSVIYLRKILENITQKVADISGINRSNSRGKRKNFKEFLEEVDKKNQFIPREFSVNGYRLFGELSEVIHGNSDEQEALLKYSALRRLVVGVIDNVKNNQEIMDAIKSLGWDDGVKQDEQN